MAEGFNNLAGGLMTGFVGSKNKAREMALNEEYKKIAMENVKATAKLHEAQIKKADLEGNLLQWAMGGESPSGMPQQQTQPQAPAQPFAQYQPMQAPAPAPPPPAPQGIPDIVASAQMPLGGQTHPIPFLSGPVNRLAPDLTTRLASMAEEFYSQTGQPLKITDGFRTYDQQADVHRRKPHLALPPGTSQHEKGLAVDVDTSQVPLLEKTGLLEKHGFIRPAMDSKGETWHLELSPTGGGLGTPQQAIPAQAQAQPARGGLTREKFLEGYMKKNFGVEPDEVKDVRYGDHTLIIDKKKGTPLFMIAGQGKTEMVDTTLPDGSIIKRPIVIPPSPLPSGIPVINMAGGNGQGGLMAGPGMQTGPPKMIYEEVTAPGGGKQKIVAPQAQPGAPPIQTEPPKGQTALEAGKMQGAQSGLDAFQKLQGLVYDKNGNVNYKNLGTAVMGGVPWTVGREINGLAKRSVDSIVRAATGATMPESEWKNFVEMYIPTGLDNVQTVNTKMRGMAEYLDGYLEKMDPTGNSRLRTGQKKLTPDNTRGMTVNPNATAPSGLSPAGQKYLQKRGF